MNIFYLLFFFGGGGGGGRQVQNIGGPRGSNFGKISASNHRRRKVLNIFYLLFFFGGGGGGGGEGRFKILGGQGGQTFRWP